MSVACIFSFVCSVGIGPVLADNDEVQDGVKKTSQGFGELLKGMGQELKKAGGSLIDSEKQDDKKNKKENKTKGDKAKANSENAK
jgi:hypothetical protein